MDNRLEIFTLGGLRILRGGTPVCGLNNRKAEALLVYLASTRRPHPREVLAEMLWDDRTQSQAFGNLRVIFTILRQALGDCLVITREYAGINPSASIWMDALQLEDCLSQLPIQGKFTSQTAPIAARTLELYQGKFLSGFSITGCRGFQEWHIQESERLHRMVVDGYSELVAYDIQRSEYQLGIVHATRLLELDPLVELAHRQMMLLLARCGQRNAALEQYETCRKLLKAELGIDPEEETRNLYERIHAGKFEGKAAASPEPVSLPDFLEVPVHNLPLQLTAFIGREDHIKKVASCLSASRLVTLTGCGGIGKTRLALEVCQRLLPDYLHGVWLVELAALTRDDQVIPAIVSVLRLNLAPGRSEVEAVVNFLRKKQLLLVLDTCEHVVQACASAALTILEHSPQVRILATSREPLGIPGEALFHVPPLTLPDLGHPHVVEAGNKSEAVRLFVERARAVSPDFGLNAANAGPIARVCSRLDGIPLALELAAARIQFITVDQINDRLQDAFRLLVGGNRAALLRQQTLWATIDWSHALLTEPESLLFHRLSVLVGSWQLEAVESICCDEGLSSVPQPGICKEEIFNLLSSLVRKSMVVVQNLPGGEVRYKLLDTIRQYAEKKLQESGETAAFRRRHLEYFTHWAEIAENKLHGPERLAWIDRMEANKENFFLAFNYAMETDPPSALHLVVALHIFWIYFFHRIEGIQCLEAALSKPENSARTMYRGRALMELVDLTLDSINNQILWDKALEGFDICVEQEDVPGQADGHNLLGYLAVTHFQNDALAKSHLEEGLQLFRSLGDRRGEARIYSRFADMYLASGDISNARQAEEQSYRIYQELNDENLMALTLLDQAFLAGEYEGKLTLAREMYEQSLEVFVKNKQNFYMLNAWVYIACLASWQGDFLQADLLISKVIDYYNYTGDNFRAFEQTEFKGRILALQGFYQQAVDLLELTIKKFSDQFPQDSESFIKSVAHVLTYSFTHLKQFDRAKHYLAYMKGQYILDYFSMCSWRWLEGLIAFYEADGAKAATRFREFLEYVNRKNFRMGILMAVEACAGGLYLLGKHREAVQCLASARAYREQIGAPVWPGDQDLHDRIQAGSEEALGEITYQAYWRTGEAMSLDQTVTLALSC